MIIISQSKMFTNNTFYNDEETFYNDGEPFNTYTSNFNFTNLNKSNPNEGKTLTHYLRKFYASLSNHPTIYEEIKEEEAFNTGNENDVLTMFWPNRELDHSFRFSDSDNFAYLFYSKLYYETE